MIDISMLAAVGSSLNSAKELAKAAIGVRDFNQISVVVSQMNDQILKAQDALFAHQSQLFAMQSELVESKEKLQKAEKALAERGRYRLVEISKGVFAYQLDASTNEKSEPIHYLCQPCFDKGQKGVLVLDATSISEVHKCPLREHTYLERERPWTPQTSTTNYDPY